MPLSCLVVCSLAILLSVQGVALDVAHSTTTPRNTPSQDESGSAERRPDANESSAAVVSTLGPSTEANELPDMSEPGHEATSAAWKVYMDNVLDSMIGPEVLRGLLFDVGLGSRTSGGTMLLLSATAVTTS